MGSATSVVAFALGLQGAQSKTVVPPAFRWAQDPDHVYLRLRWATDLKMAPAQGLQLPPELFFHDTSHFEVLASNAETSYHLNLRLWNAVSMHNTTLLPKEEGHWAIQLLKMRSAEAWPQVQKEGDPKPRNMRVWWDLQEKHQDALDALEMDSEEEKDASGDLFSG